MLGWGISKTKPVNWAWAGPRLGLWPRLWLMKSPSNLMSCYTLQTTRFLMLQSCRCPLACSTLHLTMSGHGLSPAWTASFLSTHPYDWIASYGYSWQCTLQLTLHASAMVQHSNYYTRLIGLGLGYWIFLLDIRRWEWVLWVAWAHNMCYLLEYKLCLCPGFSGLTTASVTEHYERNSKVVCTILVCTVSCVINDHPIPCSTWFCPRY